MVYKWYFSCQLGDYMPPIPPLSGTSIPTIETCVSSKKSDPRSDPRKSTDPYINLRSSNSSIASNLRVLRGPLVGKVPWKKIDGKFVWFFLEWTKMLGGDDEKILFDDSFSGMIHGWLKRDDQKEMRCDNFRDDIKRCKHQRVGILGGDKN